MRYATKGEVQLREVNHATECVVWILVCPSPHLTSRMGLYTASMVSRKDIPIACVTLWRAIPLLRIQINTWRRQWDLNKKRHFWGLLIGKLAGAGNSMPLLADGSHREAWNHLWGCIIPRINKDPYKIIFIVTVPIFATIIWTTLRNIGIKRLD